MNYITQARGTLLPIPAGVLHIETPTGVQPVPIVAGEMGETPVTMGQVKMGIDQFAAEPFGAMRFAPTGQVSGVLRGHTAEAVAAEVAVHSVGDAVGVRYSAIRRLVPEMGAFVARFADSVHSDINSCAFRSPPLMGGDEGEGGYAHSHPLPSPLPSRERGPNTKTFVSSCMNTKTHS